MSNTLEGSRQLWDSHARRDPLWAILSEPDKKGGRWDVTRFFQTGVGEISYILYQLHSRGIPMGRRAALDFGCGVGRLTQALAPHFDHVIGVDISPRMIELAAGFNRFAGRVQYISNGRPDLSAWRDGAFDVVVSSIVLQHIRPEQALTYLREFHRVLAPGGILVFQLPSHERGPGDPPAAPAVRAMPDEAYQASIHARQTPGRAVAPGSQLTLDLEVANTSLFQWSAHAFGLVRAGNHWLDRTGERMLLRDDGRTSLPETLPPGDRCGVALTITAPADEGEYLCELDLCHEGVVWFGEKGSRVLRFPVRVGEPQRGESSVVDEPASPPAAAAPIVDEPRSAVPNPFDKEEGADEPEPFPMHGIDKDTVIDFLRREGSELLHVENDPSCGADWVSFRYYVRTRR